MSSQAGGWQLEVHGQGVGRVGSLGCVLTWSLCLCAASLAFLPLLIRTLVLSIELISLKVLSPDTVILGARASTCEFWGDTVESMT